MTFFWSGRVDGEGSNWKGVLGCGNGQEVTCLVWLAEMKNEKIGWSGIGCGKSSSPQNHRRAEVHFGEKDALPSYALSGDIMGKCAIMNQVALLVSVNMYTTHRSIVRRHDSITTLNDVKPLNLSTPLHSPRAADHACVYSSSFLRGVALPLAVPVRLL